MPNRSLKNLNTFLFSTAVIRLFITGMF